MEKLSDKIGTAINHAGTCFEVFIHIIRQRNVLLEIEIVQSPRVGIPCPLKWCSQKQEILFFLASPTQFHLYSHVIEFIA